MAEASQPIYVMDLVERTGITRSLLIYRGKDLESQQLIEIIHLTDTAYRLHPAVLGAVGGKPDGLVQLIGANA